MNHGVEEEVEGMFEMGRETFALPLEGKLPFDQGDEGNQFGYVYPPCLGPTPNTHYMH